jgi:YVTN family beta-propeller protein
VSLNPPQPNVRRALGALALAALASCGGGDAPVTPSSAHMQALAATSTLPVQLAQDPDPMMEGLTIPADAPTRGMWSVTQPWPMNGLHAVLLPDGRVLTYGTPLNAPGTQDGRTWDLWTPGLGFGSASHQTNYDAGRVNSFCSAAAWLADGRLMVTGGNSPLNSGLMTTSTGAIVNDPLALADQRWYATMLTLPDGRPIILGGMDPYQEGMVSNPDAAIANGTVSMTPEVYTPGVGWSSLSGARSRDAFGPDYLRASYPRAWVAPDGRVFGISAETMWSLDPSANGGLGAVTVHGKFKTPASTTAPVNVGATNSAVMFAPGRILQAGGNGYFNGDGYPASNMATIVDINGPAPVLTETAPMSLARRYINLVVLPDGRVVATGGTRVGNNGGADAVYAAEIWNPTTGTWTVGASAAQIRVYHSATLLLPNGTVLSTGGGAPGPVNNLNAEVYYPPYLFRSVGGVAQLAPRPALTGLSARDFGYGTTMTAELRDSTPIARMVLVANGAVTHSFNSGQRFLELAFTQSGDRIAATLPASARLAPPGYYQLFALDAQGVPSRAAIVSLGLASTPAEPVPALDRGQPYVFDSDAAGQALAVDTEGLGVLAFASDNPPASTQFIVRDGLADAACVSLESVASPGRYYRHANYRLRLAAPDGSDLFRNDATFCPEAGLSGSGLTLRSKNFPGYVLRHRNGQVWIDPQAADAAFAGSASFVPRRVSAALPTIGDLPAAPLPSGATASWAPGIEGPGLSFSWDFGDGSVTPWSGSASASHVYAEPGLYTVTLSVRAADGRTATRTFVQAVHAPATAGAPRASTQMLVEPRAGASARLWVVNPDQNSVSVFDTTNHTKLAEIGVGAAPRSIARAADGSLWVANRDGASISVIGAAKLAVTRTTALPRASQPFGLVIGADGTAYVALEAAGRVLKLDPNGATLATLAVGARPRHLALTADGSRLLVSRFITPPLAGEGTASIDTTSGGGEVLVVSTATMALADTVRLAHSDRTDTEISGAGVPNYLGAALIAPDGRSAWVPSKQDNIRRGKLRNGLALDFQNTVRAISSRIDLATLREDLAARIDHDNASLANAGTYDPSGSYLFIALETARQVAVLDARRGAQLFRLEVGLAPQAVAVSPDGLRLYVHNVMSRSVSVFDLTPLLRSGNLSAPLLATPATVGSERLSATVLRGKQLFYDARDPRLARDAYLSCASCHNDGGHDGRTWDLTGFGEGLRNTINLNGRAGLGHGRLHWSANFDEVQDFEGQIRNLAGGTGLMSDTLFNAGTRSQPLGTAKAGQSADLDALAAYVASLTTMPQSPDRSTSGALSAAASAGRSVFAAQQCGSCHGGSSFQANGAQLSDVGTIKTSSGQRLGALLPGIDVPTLRDVATTGPWLHDGSAATLADAVNAHRGVVLSTTDLANLVAYLGQIGSEEAAAPANLPSGAVRCASENGTCKLPSGTPATVYYGAGSQWTVRSAMSGSVACNNSTFGDPLYGTSKACYYVTAVKCASERGSCSLPAGSSATILYGANGVFYRRSGMSGSFSCSNATFGDPIVGTFKACWRQ